MTKRGLLFWLALPIAVTPFVAATAGIIMEIGWDFLLLIGGVFLWLGALLYLVRRLV